MNLRPKTAYEKLLWERLKTKTLTEKLEQSDIENGIIRSEFDEFKYIAGRSDQLKDKYITLQAAHTSLKKHKKILDDKLKENNKSEQELIIKIAKLNLKLKSYEEKK